MSILQTMILFQSLNLNLCRMSKCKAEPRTFPVYFSSTSRSTKMPSKRSGGHGGDWIRWIDMDRNGW